MISRSQLRRKIDNFYVDAVFKPDEAISYNKDLFYLKKSVNKSDLAFIYNYYCKKEVQTINKKNVVKNDCPLNSNIKVGDIIGHGYSGNVYNLKDDDKKVIKIVKLNVSFGRYQNISKKINAEFSISKKAGKSGVGPIIYDTFTCCDPDNNCYYCIVMEKIHGTTLHDIIDSSKNKAEIDGYKSKVKQAIRKLASKGIIHRDLHLNNIIITTTGEVKIIDYGISKTLKDIIEEFVEADEKTAVNNMDVLDTDKSYSRFATLLHYIRTSCEKRMKYGK
jgi:serine/threonine protein kinase